MMMKLPIDLEKNKLQVMIAVMLASAIVLILYLKILLIPQAGRVADLLDKAGKVRRELNTAVSDIAKMGQFKETIESYKTKVDSYEKKLPAEQEIPTLLEDLSVMARDSRVKIIGLMPMAQETFMKDQKAARPKKGIYKEIPILISAKSGYHELGAFLASLENSDRFMKIADIEIKSNKATPKKHDVEIIVLTYILEK